MKTLKKLLFAALATIGFSFAAQAAVDLEAIKTRLVPEDATDVVLDTEKGEISYLYNGDQIIIYAEPGSGHTFGVPDHVTEIEYLVVGGGGGGGGGGGNCKGGGGGGGGGVITNTAPYAVDAGSTLTVMVGVGGDAGSGGSTGNKGLGGNGGESKIYAGDDVIAKALGGGGGAGGSKAALGSKDEPGEFANGGGGSVNKTAGGVGTCFAGGKANSYAGGGGAGAGEKGGAAASSGNDRAGDGGKGVYSWITGKEVCYGGGGGGGPGDNSTKYTAGLGGEGGGGDSGYYSGTTTSAKATRTGSAGTDGLGGGGGGNGYDKDMNLSGGKGGSGVVIIRYTIPVAQTKVLVTTEGEEPYGQGDLTPDYGEYEVGEYTTFIAPEYAAIDETTRAYCLGWSALDKWGDPWKEFTPSCLATITEEEAFTLKWWWEIRRQVAATATEGGSVSGLGYFASGAEVEIKATAESGYRFVAWENVPDGAVQQVDGTLTFTMGEEAVTALNAVFEAEVSSGVVVTFEGGNYGSPSPDYGTYTDYADGVERTYTNDEFAEISEGVRAYCMGYKVLDSDGQQLAAGTETSFKWTCAAGSHHTIVWIWEIRYLVTATAGEGGTVTGTDYYAAGEEVATVTATANGGYAFDGWAGDVPEGEENTNPLKLTVVDAPLAVSASFRQIPWGIALDYNKLNLPDVDQVSTNREACAVGETYTFKVPILIEKTAGAVRQRVIGYTVCTISEAGDGEETFYEGEVEDETNLVAAITYAEPVKVTWQWENDYYLTAGVNEGAMGALVEDVSGWYANNSEVTVAIKDAKYFLSWSGDIAKADRAKQSVTLTMTKAMRATAIFMTDSQDNVIANGDFEDMTGTTTVYKNFDSLLSGFWSGDEGTKVVYNGSGVITCEAGVSDEWNRGKIEGLASAWLGSQNPNDSGRAIWTDFTVYEKGTYNFSYDVKRARDSGAASKFNVIAQVCETNGDWIQDLDSCVISGTGVSKRRPKEGVYLKPGKYRLKFYHTSASGATGVQRVAAYDNVSLKLVQKKGLAIMFY